MSRRRIQFEGSLPCDPILLLEAMDELFPKIEFLPFEEAKKYDQLNKEAIASLDYSHPVNAKLTIETGYNFIA
jgi:hypothetical protein